MNLSKLSSAQKASLALFVFLLLALPVGLSLSSSPVKLFSRAARPTSQPGVINEVGGVKVTTLSLPAAKVGQAYQASIEGYVPSRDATISVSGLPSGLTKGECTFTGMTNVNFVCPLSGIPTKQEVAVVKIEVSALSGSVTEEVILPVIP